MSVSKVTEFFKGSIPVRLHVALMIFIGCATTFMLRVNMSINILAMVEPQKAVAVTELLDNSTSLNGTVIEEEEDMDFGVRYPWSQTQQSTVLGAFFYGYIVTSLPAGLASERYGAKIVIATVFTLCAILTALCPLAASIDIWCLIGARFLIGVLVGFLYPAFQYLIAKWVPPDEKGKFVSCLAGGGTFGTVITWPLSGIIISKFGWVWAFYGSALFVIIITVIWCFLITDTPGQNKRISEEEREYIEKCLGSNVSKGKSKWPPLGEVFTSIPFLALLIVHYGNLWGLNFLITAAPKFMNEVLGFKLANAGFLSSLPYIARMLSGFFFGIIGDMIMKKGLMSVTHIRKAFCVFSHILPGIFLLLTPYVSTDPYICVALIVTSLGCNGASTITNLQNAQDLAPNFVATLYGIMNFVGTTAGFLSPILVAFFTREHNTMQEWQYVFIISALIYIVPCFIFFCFGSGIVQSWNGGPKKAVEEELQETNDIECKEIKGV